MKRLISFIALLLLVNMLHAVTKEIKVHFDKTILKQYVQKAADSLDYIHLKYEDLVLDTDPGCPSLPIKHLTVTLPHEGQDISMSLSVGGISSIPISHRIFPTQELIPTSSETVKITFYPCNNELYSSSTVFPSENVKITDISCAGKEEKHVGLAICPVKYYPNENKYEFIEDFYISLNYTIKENSESKSVLSNYNPTDIPFYEYCIITNNQLKDSFTRLVSWIKEKGMTAGVIPVEDILNDAAIIGDTVSNLNDNAGKVRQYLQYAYKYGNTKYVLFGGNYSILPIRYGSRAESSLADYQVPTDLYFSDLNSNWNVDGDIYLGESKSSMDYGSELQVGRLLCTNASEVANYTDKLLRYELYPGNGNFAYLQKAIFTQADHMQETPLNGITGQANIIADDLSDIFTTETVMSELPGSYSSSTTYPTGNEVISAMNQRYGYVSWFNHGNPTSITAKANYYGETPYGLSSVCDNIPFIVQETANGLDCLTNKYFPMIAYSISCTITPFDEYDSVYSGFYNMGQSFTLGKDYGGPALIGNTRQGWVSTSYRFQLKFNEYIRNHTIGNSLNKAKYKNTYSKHDHALGVNIIGCPDLNIWTDIPTYFNATLAYNYSGSGTLTINPTIDSAFVCIRPITLACETSQAIAVIPSSGSISLSNIENCLITLKGRNCLPQILPLYLQSTNVNGYHYMITSDVTCGSNVRNGSCGNVIFKSGSDTEIESSGTVRLMPGTTIELGAKLSINQSDIDF